MSTTGPPARTALPVPPAATLACRDSDRGWGDGALEADSRHATAQKGPDPIHDRTERFTIVSARAQVRMPLCPMPQCPTEAVRIYFVLRTKRITRTCQARNTSFRRARRARRKSIIVVPPPVETHTCTMQAAVVVSGAESAFRAS